MYVFNMKKRMIYQYTNSGKQKNCEKYDFDTKLPGPTLLGRHMTLVAWFTPGKVSRICSMVRTSHALIPFFNFSSSLSAKKETDQSLVFSVKHICCMENQNPLFFLRILSISQ